MDRSVPAELSLMGDFMKNFCREKKPLWLVAPLMPSLDRITPVPKKKLPLDFV